MPSPLDRSSSVPNPTRVPTSISTSNTQSLSSSTAKSAPVTPTRLPAVDLSTLNSLSDSDVNAAQHMIDQHDFPPNVEPSTNSVVEPVAAAIDARATDTAIDSLVAAPSTASSAASSMAVFGGELSTQPLVSNSQLPVKTTKEEVMEPPGALERPRKKQKRAVKLDKVYRDAKAEIALVSPDKVKFLVRKHYLQSSR